MTTFAFDIETRAVPWRIVRLEAPGETTLEELARRIAREFELEPDRHAFFRSGLAWDARSEYTTEEGEGRPLRGARLDRLALRVGATILHLHGSKRLSWHLLRVTALSPDPGGLRVLACETPEPDEGPLALRLGAVLAAAAPALEPSEDERRAALARSFRVADELLTDSRTSLDELESLGHQFGVDLEGWLIDLPVRLAEVGLVDEALQLSARGEPFLPHSELLADRARILAEAGRPAAARAQIEAVLARFPGDPWVALKCGDAGRTLGDVAWAEEQYHRGLEEAQDLDTRIGALERLTALLDEQGRAEQAHPLRRQLERAESERERQEDAQGEEAEFTGDDTEDDSEGESEREELTDGDFELGAGGLAPAPRVGRNDPCPCGSGKKYKKCCASGEAQIEREIATQLLQSEHLTHALHQVVEAELATPRGESARHLLGRFAGSAFEGLEPEAAFPLLPAEEAELAYFHWWLLDREESPGTTLFDDYLRRRRAKLPPRDLRLVTALQGTRLSLYWMERPDLRRPDVEIVDRISDERFLVKGLTGFTLPPHIRHFLGRHVELDGQPFPLRMPVSVEERHVEPLLALVRPRLAADAAMPPAREDRAPFLFQAWLDVLHGVPARSS
jgi:hypothetical protein